MLRLSKKAVSPVIAIVLLLMMTVAAAGAAYFWLTSMQSSVQQSAGSQIEAITKSVSTRVIAQATICKVPAEEHLVGRWPIDEHNSTHIFDVSGNNYDRALKDANSTNADGNTPPQFVEGKYGEALHFDGLDDYVVHLLSFEERFTILLWFKADEAQYNKFLTSDHYNNFCMTLKDDGDVSYSVKSDGPCGWSCGAGRGGDYKDFTWHMAGIVAWEHGNNFTAESYFDNHLIGSYEYEGNLTSQGGALGRRGDSGYYNGSIDEVRIYDRNLSKEKLAYEQVDITVYNAGTEEVPAGAWVANLKKGENIIESDVYNATELESEERITLNFYFDKMKPGKEYKIELEGTQTSTTVSC